MLYPAPKSVQNQTSAPKSVENSEMENQSSFWGHLPALMDVTPSAVAARLGELATTDSFFDLDKFEPETARDIAILYEVRAGAVDSFPGFEIRKGGISRKPNRFVSGPNVLVRRKERAK